MPTASTLVTMYYQHCIGCGICFGVPNSFDEERRRDGVFFHCPNGHKQCYSDSTEKRLARELAKKDQELARQKEATQYQRERAEREERRVAAQKGIVTRLKKKVAAGTCPCCEKLFPDLSSHMVTEHPDFEGAAEAEEKADEVPGT